MVLFVAVSVLASTALALHLRTRVLVRELERLRHLREQLVVDRARLALLHERTRRVAVARERFQAPAAPPSTASP